MVFPTPGSFGAYVMIVTHSVPTGSIEFTVDIGSTVWFKPLPTACDYVVLKQRLNVVDFHCVVFSDGFFVTSTNRLFQKIYDFM